MGPSVPDFNFAARQSISPTFANRIDELFAAGVGADLTLLQEREFRARFRDYVQSGVDMVKVAISDHLTAHLNPVALRTYHTFPEKWVRMMAEDTRAAGLPFLSHTLAVPALELATDVDVDVMIHPTWTYNQVIPDELVRRIAEKRIGVGIQPLTDDYSGRLLAHGNFFGAMNSPEHQKNERNFIDAGANVMVATDAGCTSHDVMQDLGEELHEDRPWTLGADHFTWVKALRTRGLSAMGAIQALTHNVADAYNKLDTIGTVEVGKVADLGASECGSTCRQRESKRYRGDLQRRSRCRPVRAAESACRDRTDGSTCSELTNAIGLLGGRRWTTTIGGVGDHPVAECGV